ncbi:MAG TPA: hypothetical protein VMB34_03925 [Acetobacteraceae bacterium]|nr:hypothetical protein [Acetobacteraceae bacterium]
MRNWFPVRVVLAVPLLLLPGTPVLGAPQNFDLGSNAAPPVATHGKPLICTVTYLVEDVAANETYAARMQFTPSKDAVVGANARMSCPAMIPPTVSDMALRGCRDHAARPADCVFADMSRGFSDAPSVDNTSDNAARCESDAASQIAIACWNAGKMDVCNVGCGNDPKAAEQAARHRCELKHEQYCNIAGSLPVAAP